MASTLTQQEWLGLAKESEGLAGQEYANFPSITRSLPQLQQHAENLRQRSNRYRSNANQAAATRLLAQQGFDATRLTQEVVSLEIVPTIEDVFHAETSSVEEYLQQVEESTLLATIQEAQQDAVSSFEGYMEQCMARDWAANRRQLFGLIAPHATGFGGPAPGPSGPQPLIGRAPHQAGVTGFGGAGAAAVRLTPREQAYVDVVKRSAQAAGGPGSVDLIKEFAAACKGHDDKAHETPVSSLWALLADVVGEARQRAGTPAAGQRYLEAMLAGARKHLERGHQQHVRATITKYKVAAERGADPDHLREVQAYVQVKFGRDSSRGALDFQQPGGMDTSWIQLYYALRSGYDVAARRAAERCHDPRTQPTTSSGISGALGLYGGGAGGSGDSSFRPYVDEWLRGNGRLSDSSAKALSREADRLVREARASLRQSAKAPYQALVCALLSGDSRAVDALSGALQGAGLPAVLSTIEDFMWAKLVLVGASSSAPQGAAGGQQGGLLGGSAGSGLSASGPPPYTLSDFQADINRWPPSYYSKNGAEPLLYATVLLLSCQLAGVVRFLWRDDSARPYRVDAVHIALALQAEGLLPLLQQAPTQAQQQAGSAAGEAPLDVGALLQSYGQKFVAADSSTALQYYWLAAAAKGGSLAVKGQLLRELLAASRDYGTLLGGGGPGARGALHSVVQDPQELRQLLESVAYECQVQAQPEEAVELYLAADKPVAALALLNAQISAGMTAAVDEAAASAGATTGPACERMQRLVSRGLEALQRLSAQDGVGTTALDTAAAREKEAYGQLLAIRDMLTAAKQGRHDAALQQVHNLAFIPLERSRLELCSRMVGQLHPAVAERLQDVIMAAADSLAARRAGASREAVYALKLELDALTAFANGIVALRLPQHLYRKLSEAQVHFS